MKKIFITIIAIATMMSLVSCGGKSEATVTNGVIEENVISENMIEEHIFEETIEWTSVQFGNKTFNNVYMTKTEMDDLRNRFDNGLISEEYVAEILSNSQSNRW